jgi:hypothetical protein
LHAAKDIEERKEVKQARQQRHNARMLHEALVKGKRMKDEG